MKPTFSHVTLQVLLLLCALLAFSCKEDKEEDPAPDTTNQLEYNGQKYTFKSGLVEDYGPLSVFGTTNTHHNYDFTILDGTFTKQADNSYAPTSASSTVMVFAELFSPGTAGFTTGTFTHIAPTDNDDDDLNDTELESKYKNKAYFNYALVFIDSNNNKTLEQTDIILIATGGTIKVSGSAANPTLEYNLTLHDGKTLTGSYTGGFTYSDETD
ncbi:hypothetical protein [Botryobacter ruber]|uniref:hypothetical protein n=1 Tax=Botryobacter ruber TaxID=2171629 RepID=UPI000E09FECF|nr:hypothetical protein [Botryobacter ruber]